MQYDLNNEIFHLAVQIVNQGQRNIFLTGKAGTGKTTFLKYLRENCPKQIAVVAPTGVAAINAGGVTIHSFFQLPFSPFLPDNRGFSQKNEETTNRHSLLSRLRLTNEKKKIFQELELLIIDEISMVRCDALDAIDAVLRHVRHRQGEQFGGVQVLFIGDMYQLPPVIPENEWSLLSEFYESPYFFDSRAIKEQPPLYIEFNKIYRQSEEQFIRLLNQVRNNELNAEGISLLEKRFQPALRYSSGDGYIILTTHNYKADAINAEELNHLSGKPAIFKAEITGEFTERSFPADELLQLKKGAQVMFIKNDSDKSKRYFNGKIGRVIRLTENEIFVQCGDEQQEIEVNKETWENIRYRWNKNIRMLDEEVLGSFKQYPLRLAWAITIHKSQGLTFERAIIDAGDAFASGQVYVALSRCTNLDGLVLQSRIRKDSFRCDERIVRFSKNNSSTDLLAEELAISRREYLQAILLSIFNFAPTINDIKELTDYLLEHRSSFNIETFSWIEELIELLSSLQQTAEKFHTQLKALFQKEVAKKNNILGDRIIAAADYFTKQLELILQKLYRSPAITDSRQHAREYNESIKEIFAQLAMKKYLIEACYGQFNIETFHQHKNKFILPSFTVNAYAGNADQQTENPHPVLYRELRKQRDNICARKDLPIYFVAGSRTLDEMARYLPQTLEELEKISGFGEAKITSYGQQFLDIILKYCKSKLLQSNISEKKPKRQRKTKGASPKADTKAETFKLYRERKSVIEIAEERNLTIQTIESHLSYYVQEGSIDILELITSDKLMMIEPAIKDFSGGSITPIKEKLGNDISYGEIRLAIAWSLFKQKA